MVGFIWYFVNTLLPTNKLVTSWLHKSNAPQKMVFMLSPAHLTLVPKEMRTVVANLDEDFDSVSFDWNRVKGLGLLKRCVPTDSHRTCGKLLSFCIDQVTSFREKIGIKLCVFKIGVTSNPVVRYKSYVEKNYCNVGDCTIKQCRPHSHA